MDELQFQWFTGQARRAIAQAHAIAKRRRNDFLSTDHLLGGLLREPSPTTAGVFGDQGIDPASIREHLAEQLYGQSAEILGAGTPVCTPRVVETLRRAVDLAEMGSASAAGTGHLLLAMLQDPDNSVRGFLIERGFDADRGERWLRAAPAETNRDLSVKAASGSRPSGARVEPSDPSAEEVAALLVFPPRNRSPLSQLTTDPLDVPDVPDISLPAPWRPTDEFPPPDRPDYERTTIASQHPVIAFVVLFATIGVCFAILLATLRVKAP